MEEFPQGSKKAESELEKEEADLLTYIRKLRALAGEGEEGKRLAKEDVEFTLTRLKKLREDAVAAPRTRRELGKRDPDVRLNDWEARIADIGRRIDVLEEFLEELS